MRPGEIPFTIKAEGKEYSGWLEPSGIKLPWGVPIGFDVHLPGEQVKTIIIENGEWSMDAPMPFVNALISWIENYYEEIDQNG